MDNAPEISVIVPVYKVEKYLPQCIESILAQTFTDFELLLIDDGSPDSCGEICEKYARNDKRIRVFHQDNAGLSCARNVGLINASGNYIAFIDSDDYIRIDYLESLYAMLPENKDVMGVVIGGFDKLLPDGNRETVHVPNLELVSENNYLVLTDLIDKSVAYAWSKLYDNRLIKQHHINFVPSISGLEDILFMLDYLIYSDFVHIRDCNNYVYRVGYSMNTLSTRINSFNAEYAAFSNFLNRVYFYQKKYFLTDNSLIKTWELLTIFFHKVILSIYKTGNNYNYRQRVSFLCKTLSNDKCWIKKHYFPHYKADMVGKFLLYYAGARAFDMWMCFLLSVKYKKMFGANRVL